MACTSNEIRQELRTEFEVKIFPLHAHEQEVPLPRDGAGGGGGGVLTEKLGGGVRPASQTPYPVYDQNRPYFATYT